MFAHLINNGDMLSRVSAFVKTHVRFLSTDFCLKFSIIFWHKKLPL